MTVQEAFDKFIRSRLREGRSEKTIESYTNLTYPLRSYLGPDFELENLRQEMIEDFIDIYVLFFLHGGNFFAFYSGEKTSFNFSRFVRHDAFKRWRWCGERAE